MPLAAMLALPEMQQQWGQVPSIMAARAWLPRMPDFLVLARVAQAETSEQDKLAVRRAGLPVVAEVVGAAQMVDHQPSGWRTAELPAARAVRAQAGLVAGLVGPRA